ncbi:MAG TPA: 23S rRNA (uracil(1939)-C(5))-methyltransferase RlmD [Eubacterium sp.]|nr:23S rRNA (uracil(1939)-C(5))-methyltransferase RlmD [Eubacterium sp.]
MSYSKNDCVELTIEDIGVSGEGIGKVDGYTLFVKDTVIGDVVRVKIMKAKKNYGYARLMDIIKPSKDRVEPACPIARQCGGCQIQAMNYNAQLKYKQKLVKDNLLRISGLTEGADYEMCEILGMDTPFRYRNKAQYPVGEDKDGNIVMGFYAGHTHSIIACPDDDCMLGHRDNAFILNAVKEWMKEYRVRAYNENIHKGTVRHVLIRTGYHTDEVMVCLVTKKMLRKEAADGLVKAIQKLKLNVASLVVNINKEDTNVILGKECITLYGRPYIEDYIGDIKFQISPLSFYQVNPKQTEVLYNKALEFARLKGNESVWDMYCGIGTISLFLAKKSGKVYGVEIVPQAIEDAKNNAKINNIDNAEFFVGKAEEVVPAFYKKQTGVQSDNDSTDSKEYDMTRPDVVVVDPPRKGCDKKLLDTIVSMTPDRIVYVSCDSATLARDLKLLVEYGYKVEKVQPVDQFGNTVHVETVVLLSQLKQKPDDYINVTIELDDVDITSAETKATYDEIKKYVFEHNAGMKVSNLYISQVKRKCGIEVGKNYNLPKNEDSRQPQCPEDKERAIVEALEHFKMIQQE